ncbi:MAG: CopG family transcriptional regulator [Clostridia bacterium]|nr:CopG family transcriptional regulator [Clostridia bacterium]
MRNRNIKINIFLNEDEKKIFDEKAKKSGLSKSEFFRKIILDYQLKEQPDERFYEMLSQLRGMANNLNQMARTYNRYQGYMKDDKFTPLLNQIQDFVLSMQDVYLTPQKKGASNGNNKNMEIQEQARHPYRICN